MSLAAEASKSDPHNWPTIGLRNRDSDLHSFDISFCLVAPLSQTVFQLMPERLGILEDVESSPLDLGWCWEGEGHFSALCLQVWVPTALPRGNVLGPGWWMWSRGCLSSPHCLYFFVNRIVSVFSMSWTVQVSCKSLSALDVFWKLFFSWEKISVQYNKRHCLCCLFGCGVLSALEKLWITKGKWHCLWWTVN